MFPAIFSPVPFGLLPRSLCSASSFLSVRSFVPFVSLLRFFRSALSFSSVRFLVSFGLLFRFLRSVSSFLSVCSFVFFGPFLSFFRSALSFSSVCFLVSFGLLFRFLRPVSCFFWSVSTRHCFVVSSFLSLSSLPFCQLFSLLSNPTHAFQHLRPCPSTFKTTPFLSQDHALQRSRTRPSSCVSVCAWFRVSCKAYFVSCPPPCVGVLVCVFVKTFYNPKRLVGYFISHRFSQMNRSLSANRGNSPTPAGRRQISQNLLLYITECYIHRELKRSVLSVDLMSLCAFGPSVLLCSSVRERTPSVTFLRSSVTLSPVLSNLFTCLLVHLSTCLVTLSQPSPTISPPSVTHQTCSSVTLSPISSNLFTCLLVHLSTCLVTLS